MNSLQWIDQNSGKLVVWIKNAANRSVRVAKADMFVVRHWLVILIFSNIRQILELLSDKASVQKDDSEFFLNFFLVSTY